MDARLNLFENAVVMKFIKHINSANRALHESSLPSATQELVKLRASQINGCGFCTDMHIKDALEAGETQLRLNLVAVWREATVFTDPEKAALELTEQGTRIADASEGVTDEAWANAEQILQNDAEFHVVLRKWLADHPESTGARRSVAALSAKELDQLLRL